MSSPTARKRSKSVDGSPMKRARSGSRGKLEELYRLLDKTILEHQHPVTGLLPAFLYADGTPGWAKNDAWVRDNVYSVLSIWGMAIAYRHQADTEDDRLTAYQLEQSVVKLMRGLLMCMMAQVEKVEAFKRCHDRGSCLHAKYSLSTCGTVVGDYAWGHLQIDATSLYLLMLAEMTAAGLQIVFSLDEVAFVQNLVFYVEEAYRIPDYGIWERGDKSNHGEMELNASSIGMAKAALEAISGLDLFGAQGGQSSVIHVMHDLVAQCHTKLHSLLPRESSSKEVDGSLLTIIGYPAFAVENPDLIQETRDKIISKLMGRYGCRRFLRDGNQTVKEDSSRLHYEPAELKVFENIECEWPLFLLLLLLEALIEGNTQQVEEYRAKLDKLILTSEDTGLQTVPELYYVPADKVDMEYREPHSQDRLPGSKTQHMWSQSLFILCNLLEERFINIGEIDPLNRRLSQTARQDTLVQVVLLAEGRKVRTKLSDSGIPCETIRHVEHSHNNPVKILPARCLTKIYEHLGVNKKMGLTGRPPHTLGVIATSQLYSYALHSQHVFAFTPQFLDHESFYLSFDNQLLVDLIRTDLAYLKSNWSLIGRPTIVLPILGSMLGGYTQWEQSPIYKLLLILASGYSSGVRVKLGTMKEFFSTASMKKLNFIAPSDASEILDIPIDLRPHRQIFLQHGQRNSLIKVDTSRMSKTDVSQTSLTRKVLGSVRRSRKTPPLKARHSTLPDISMVATPEEARESRQLKFALAWSHRDSISTGHLPSGNGGSGTNISQSPSTSSLKGLNLETHNVDDVVQKLQHESNIYVQADYLTYLYTSCGKDFVMHLSNQECTVGLLVEELYKKAAAYGMWSLVRHTAGMLHKRVEDLGSSVTDLLVRQKIVSVGQHPNEEHITQPRTSAELLNCIVSACGGDYTSIALTQEILVYLAMFIRSEPELFTQMLRLRIGLIHNVMVLELSRTMSVSSEDAVEKLLDLSPYDLKHLLHLIFSSREFTVDEIKSKAGDVSGLMVEGEVGGPIKQLSIIAPSKKRVHGKLQKHIQELGSRTSPASPTMTRTEESQGHGHWQRRRRLDGALNRVPPDFYSDVWHILESCCEINFGWTTDSVLPQYPTIQEMTPGELKFALTLERKLNSVPDPEYRQLVVEALIIFSLVMKSNGQHLTSNRPLVVAHVINAAQRLFLEDQKSSEGPAYTCCVKDWGSCGGPASICVHFYDSAPSGRYGTMSYLAQAVSDQLKGRNQSSSSECKIS